MSTSEEHGESEDQLEGTDSDVFVMPSKRGIDMTNPQFDPEEFMDMLAQEFASIQREKLREILARNASVEYLQRHGLKGRTDVDSFRRLVPVVTYEDLESDLMSLANGKTTAPILTVDPIESFIISSGTTAGRPKYFLGTSTLYDGGRHFEDIKSALLHRFFPKLEQGLSFSLLSAGMQWETPPGIKGGGLFTNYYRSSRFTNRVRNPKDEMCAPDAVVLCNDINQGMYCHLVCALAQSTSIVRLYTLFSVSMVGAIRELQEQWTDIVEDIRTGTLNPKITEPEVRSEVESKVLMNKPNPELATKIAMECSKEDWGGIIPRLFPNAQLVECIVSGSMHQYVPALQHFSGHLPISSPLYGLSEAHYVGFNATGNGSTTAEETYMLWPEAAYFEFIPEDKFGGAEDGNKDDGFRVLEVGDLELGRDYELLLTTVSGLYRFRTGDVLRVKRFKRNYPLFEFLRRKNVVLSVNLEKTDEPELQTVIDKAYGLLKGTSMEVVDYTSTVDLASLPGHYIIYWEMVNNGNLDESVLQECTNTMDSSLSDVYHEGREENLIGPLELRVLKEGTLADVKALTLKSGASPIQYKQPRFMNDHDKLQLMNEKTLLSFRSTSAIVKPMFGTSKELVRSIAISE